MLLLMFVVVVEGRGASMVWSPMNFVLVRDVVAGALGAYTGCDPLAADHPVAVAVEV